VTAVVPETSVCQSDFDSPYTVSRSSVDGSSILHVNTGCDERTRVWHGETETKREAFSPDRSPPIALEPSEFLSLRKLCTTSKLPLAADFLSPSLLSAAPPGAAPGRSLMRIELLGPICTQLPAANMISRLGTGAGFHFIAVAKRQPERCGR
jgi:hypothetical protein